MYDYIALDCASLLYANAYKLKQLKANEVETGAIYGFFRNLLFISQHFHCNRFLFCWDNKNSDRVKLFPEYKAKRKANRKADPELDKIFQALFAQIDKLKNEILPQCGFNNQFEQDGKEADDILANIVLHYPNVLMVTNDEDMFQMLDMCDIWNPGKQKLWSERAFIKEYSITPLDWVQVKSVSGCTSDEIPGIPNVGEKTAIKWINKELGSHLKAYKNILNGKELIEFNRKLVELPITGTKDLIITEDNLDFESFEMVCEKYLFYSFLEQYISEWERFFEGRV